jgi:hypothetical protein
MATTKAILAQQVIRRISGGDQPADSQLDQREVIKLVVQAMGEKIKENFFENYKLGDPGYDGMYIATYKEQNVLYDSGRGEYYSVIPSNYVALPNGRGILQVSPMRSPRKAFKIRKAGNVAIYDNLPAGNLQGNLGVYPEGLKLFYTGEVKKAGIIGNKTVIIKIVSGGPDAIGDNDPLPIDQAAELAVVERALQFLQAQVPQDKLNNNNPQE